MPDTTAYLKRRAGVRRTSIRRQKGYASVMTVTTLAATPRLLMCPPQHFAVTYSINPWMDPAKWADDGSALQARAAQQWVALHGGLRAGRAARVQGL